MITKITVTPFLFNEAKITEIINNVFASLEADGYKKSNVDKLKDAKEKPQPKESAKAENFKGIINEMYNTYLKKSSDYGDSYAKSHQRFGTVVGIMHPLTTKMDRLTELLNSKKPPQNESIEDTLLDLAIYAILGVMELRR